MPRFWLFLVWHFHCLKFYLRLFLQTIIRYSMSTSCLPASSFSFSSTVTSLAARGFVNTASLLFISVSPFRHKAIVNKKGVNEDLADVKIVNTDQEKKLSVYIKRAEHFTRSISSPFEVNSMVSEMRTHTNFGSFYLRLGTICK